MAKFKAFKPQAMERIARGMGYSGDMSGFQQYLDSNVSLKQRMKQLEDSAIEMADSGVVRMPTQTQQQPQDTIGGFVEPPKQTFQQGGLTSQPFVNADPNNMPLVGNVAGALGSVFGRSGGTTSTTNIPLLDRQFSRPPSSPVPIDRGGAQPTQQRELYKFSPTGGIYNTLAPQEGFRFAYTADGTRVSIPEAEFARLPFGGPKRPRVKDKGVREIAPQETIPTPVRGGSNLPQQFIPQAQYQEGQNIQDLMARQAQAPALPMGSTIVPQGTLQEAGQMINPATGQLTGAIQTPIAQATTAQTQTPMVAPATQIAPATTQQNLKTLQAEAQQNVTTPVVSAQVSNASSISNLDAAQGTAIEMQNPVQRQIQAGEVIAPIANAQTASQFTEQVQAATATPTEQATVQGQLAGLMQQFESGDTPAWAAGAIRAANHAMIQRGVGASSMAGQAIVQAAMESALPIASADAQTQAQFEAQNLSNRQQRAMLAAQQRATFIGQEFDQAFQARVQNASRVSDIANMNFNAEQQIGLENSRAVNTMNLNNLGNRQAIVLAEASALANMDLSNLSNRQQAAVMNAQSFMQTDMANLSNRQQTELFNAQARQQSMFTDQAALNAAAQFNASSQNQVNQFFSQLQSQVGQFNASQANAQSQYNAGQVNTIERFNAELNNQREQFNAQNRLVIDQANAQWRRQIATADTTAINRANELNATALLGLSNTAYNNLWQHYGDVMEWAWTSSENNAERVLQMAMAELDAKVRTDLKNLDAEISEGKSIGGLVSDLFFKPIAGSLIGGIFG
jgi:hypothetical protein